MFGYHWCIVFCAVVYCTCNYIYKILRKVYLYKTSVNSSDVHIVCEASMLSGGEILCQIRLQHKKLA